MITPADEAALALRRALVEVLRQLNRYDTEEPEVPGLEAEELCEILARGALPPIPRAETQQAIEVLVGNGYARELTDARYAWSRGRMVGSRYAITTPGKVFLLQAVQRAGRI